MIKDIRESIKALAKNSGQEVVSMIDAMYGPGEWPELSEKGLGIGAWYATANFRSIELEGNVKEFVFVRTQRELSELCNIYTIAGWRYIDGKSFRAVLEVMSLKRQLEAYGIIYISTSQNWVVSSTLTDIVAAGGKTMALDEFKKKNDIDRKLELFFNHEMKNYSVVISDLQSLDEEVGELTKGGYTLTRFEKDLVDSLREGFRAERYYDKIYMNVLAGPRITDGPRWLWQLDCKCGISFDYTPKAAVKETAKDRKLIEETVRLLSQPEGVKKKKKSGKILYAESNPTPDVRDTNVVEKHNAKNSGSVVQLQHGEQEIPF